ncbi:folylpolyglutamate synthase, partial [Lecanoromycetidae sp. Uapishka_2]
MSCVLWRLHEHINRNDINELFFLTDQSELRITAEKLNVAVRSVQELKQLLASETKVDNIATLGDLEREFGIQQRTSGSADLNGLTSVSSEDKIAPPLADGMVKSHDDTSRLSSNGKHDRHDGNGAYRKGEFQTEEQEDGTISNGPGDDQASPVLVKANEECTAEKPSAESAITLTKVSTATKPPWNAVVRGDSYETNHTLSNGEQINGHVLGTSHGTMPQDDFSRDSQEKLEISPSSPSTEKLPSYFDAVKPSLATQEQQSQVSPLQSSLSTLVSTPVQSCQLEIEPEDSDEEVVVFKPSAKRYSTQKKPAQQNVKPSTPKTSSQPKTSTPRIQPQQPPSQPKSLTPVIEPKQQLSNGTPVPAVLKLPPQPATGSSHGRHTVAVSHGHPQSKSSPMVIDPDAFGRSFAVNTNSSPRTLQHPRSHHHARTPVQNSQNPQASRSSRREHQRTTSNHHIPHEDSQRLSPAPEPRAETSPRMSPRRRPRPFEPEASVPKTFDPTPGAGRRPTTPASKNGDFDDFVSRSAFPEAQLKPQVIQARPVDPAEIAARSGNTESVAKKILSPPDSFEHTGGFVSRSAMSQPLYKPRASEPEYIEPRASMPDVDALQEAVQALNTLQSNFATIDAIRKSGRSMNKNSIPEMIEWCRRIGYEPSDFSDLNAIHIAGTKGKGSTSAFISSILNQYLPSSNHPTSVLNKVGLYTSPHLRFVRERIQINNEPLSEEAFAKYFFEVWDHLEDAARQRGEPTDPAAKPLYFRFLTLMAFHAYKREGVDTAIIECGIGGEYDTTNVLVEPTVTGITSLGIDHTHLLGSTIEDIAWHKGGIMKKGVPCYTAPQNRSAIEVLRKRALEKCTSIEIVDRHPELVKVKLGLAADFQNTNARLAIAIARHHLTKLGQPLPSFANSLPSEFIRGLEEVRWPGRCETRHEEGISWYIDGGHTLESIEVAGSWFASQIHSTPAQGVKSTRILLFNQQTRDANALAKALHRTLAAALNEQRPFTHAIFCTNVTFKEAGYRPDLMSMNTNATAIGDLEVQLGLAETWRNVDDQTNIEVKGSIEEAVDCCRDIASAEEDVMVLATGSLHLVGGLLEVLETKRSS